VDKLPDKLKPELVLKKRERANTRLFGVKGDGVRRKIAQEPGRSLGKRKQQSAGRHNCKTGPEGKSEMPIVVKKPGNAGGAKGHYCKQCIKQEERRAT
jgi:hypothetical protein